MESKHGAKWGGGLADAGANHPRHNEVTGFVDCFVLEEGEVERAKVAVVVVVMMMVSGLGLDVDGGQR